MELDLNQQKFLELVRLIGGTENAQKLLDLEDKSAINYLKELLEESQHDDKAIGEILNCLKSHRNFLNQIYNLKRAIPPEELLQSEYNLRELIQEWGYNITDNALKDILYCRPKVSSVSSGCGEILITLLVNGAGVSKAHGDVKIGNRIVEIGSNDKRIWGQGVELDPRAIHSRFLKSITQFIPGIENLFKITKEGMIKNVSCGTKFGQTLMEVQKQFPGTREIFIRTFLESIFEDTSNEVINKLTKVAMDRIEYLDNMDAHPGPERYGQCAVVSIATLVLSKYIKNDKFTDFLFIDHDTYDVKYLDVDCDLKALYKFCNDFKWGSFFGFGSMDRAPIMRRTCNSKDIFPVLNKPRYKKSYVPAKHILEIYDY